LKITKAGDFAMVRRATIGDIASEVNVSPSTLRNWCDEGLLEHRRDFRGWRWFPNPSETIQRVQDLIYGRIVAYESRISGSKLVKEDAKNENPQLIAQSGLVKNNAK
jgi:transposase-like protein